MSLIIEDLRGAIGIEPNNLGFDAELFPNINAVKSILVQLGVTELDITIDDTTSWPVFNSDVVGEFAKQYLILKLKRVFDPTASETIERAFKETIQEYEVRIVHELDEEAANA